MALLYRLDGIVACMATPDSTREHILNALERLIIAGGAASVTLAAVAEEASVSKGGLLYHFGSKADLVGGLVDRLARLGAEDLHALRTSPEGPVAAFIRSSCSAGAPLDNTMIAIIRLASTGEFPAARAAMDTLDLQWRALIHDTVGDDDRTTIVMLVSDGLYSRAAIDPGSAVAAFADVDRIIATVERLLAG